MIYQPYETGWLAITQPAHAWMAGALAAAWGNGRFARPEPYDAVVLASRLHDIGWLPWDAAPRLGEDGQPVNFLHTTLAETIPTWKQGVGQVAQLNPYSGLLVSLHATTIFQRRLERGIDTPEQQGEILAQMAGLEAWREDLVEKLAGHPVYGTAVSPTHLRTAYRWLRVCDLLSLVALSDVFPPEGEITEVPGPHRVEIRTIRYVRRNNFQLHLDPYPFTAPILPVAIQARRLSDRVFADEQQFAAALAQGVWQQLEITYRALGV